MQLIALCRSLAILEKNLTVNYSTKHALYSSEVTAGLTKYEQKLEIHCQ